MLFNSIGFVLFLPAIVVLYYLCPVAYRWLLVLGASYFFYMCWRPEYIVLIIAGTLVVYFSGLAMQQHEGRLKRLPYLIFALSTNLGLLFFFKYFIFFSHNLNPILERLHIASQIPEPNVLLPVGISFFTFQMLSYAIDVYKGRQKAETHFGYFALYVSFFPSW